MQSLWMVAAGLMFALMGVCVKLGTVRFPVAEMVFFRSVIPTLLLYGYVRAAGMKLVTPHWRVHLTRGLSGFVAMLTYFTALSLIPLATAATLAYSSPLFLALLLIFWRRERVRALVLLSVVAGFAGVALLLRPTLHVEQIVGGLFGLGSGIATGITYLLVRKLGELGEPEWLTVFYFSLIATAGGLIWALATGAFHAIDTPGWQYLAGVGICGGLGQLCMTRAYKHGKTMVTASLAYTAVVFASIFGFWLWDERLSVLAWLGIVLIVASGVLSGIFSQPSPAKPD